MPSNYELLWLDVADKKMKIIMHNVSFNFFDENDIFLYYVMRIYPKLRKKIIK